MLAASGQLSSNETRARVEQGRARVREFSWSASVDRLCAVFEQALGVTRPETVQPATRGADESA